MSSPTKQVGSRRLPPLANQVISGRAWTVPLKHPKLTDVEEREAFLVGTSDTTSGRNVINQAKKGATFFFLVYFFASSVSHT